MLLPKDAVSENPLLLMTQVFLGLEWGLETDWFACMELAKAKAHLTNVLKRHALAEQIYVVISAGFLSFIHLAEGGPGEAERIISSLQADGAQKHDTFARTTMNALLVELARRQGKIDGAERLSHGVDCDCRPAPHRHRYRQNPPAEHLRETRNQKPPRHRKKGAGIGSYDARIACGLSYPIQSRIPWIFLKC